MTARAYILKGDSTTVGGIVLDGLDDVSWNDRGLSYLGARVSCPVCKTIGLIAQDGERADEELTGKKPALDQDFCACKCSPFPRVRASQDDWTTDA